MKETITPVLGDHFLIIQVKRGFLILKCCFYTPSNAKKNNTDQYLHVVPL